MRTPKPQDSWDIDAPHALDEPPFRWLPIAQFMAVLALAALAMILLVWAALRLWA